MPFIRLVPPSLRFAIALLWLAAALAAWLVLPQNTPLSVRLPFLLAACVELACFVSLGWPSVREQLAQLPPRTLALLLTVSGLVPYALYALPTGVFHPLPAFTLLALTGLTTAWYLLFRHGLLRDAAFLVLIATVMLTGLFRWIYPEAVPKLPSEFLGRILWIRLGIAATLLLRRLPGTGFGFWPTAREWRNGAFAFLLLFPVLYTLGQWLEFFSLRELTRPWYQTAAIALGTFFGIFYVVALSEEFFLRGVLQQTLRDSTRRPWLALTLTSLISGALHLPFRGFPNVDFAILATVAHAAYGLVYQRNAGIRAPMVTHALIVTVWRTFLA